MNNPGKQEMAAKRFFFAALFVVIAGTIGMELRELASPLDPNGWAHLSTGLWILAQRAVPSHGLFAVAAEARPWVDGGWGFQVLLAGAYRLMGLKAMVFVGIVLRCLLAAVLFWLAGGMRRGGAIPGAVVALAAIWLMGALPCAPQAVSMLLLALEMAVLLHAQRLPGSRALLALPLLFWIWACMAPEFVFGLAVLALFAMAQTAERLWRRESPSASLWGVLAASVAAPLLAPYSYRLYPNFLAELYGDALFKYFAGLKALGFRQPRDFALTVFLMGAFFVLGRRRHVSLLLTMLLSLMLAFRISRDAWVAVVMAAPVYGLLWPEGEEEERLAMRLLPSALAVMLLMLAASVALIPSRATIERKVAERFPAQAVHYIAENRLPQPLFNLADWGGYLTFALPGYPVTTDGRITMYGDESYIQIHQVSDGEVDLTTVPAFAEARTLILPATTGLTQALTKLPVFRDHYQVVYQDSVAAVLLRRD